MLKFIGALLVGILSASLAVIYQDDIAGFVGRAPVTVHVTAGGWYPHPAGSSDSFSEADEDHIGSFSQPKEANFARLVISNNTGREVPNSVIKVGDEDSSIWKYDAVVLTKQKGKAFRTIVEDTNRIELGPLPAAQDTVVYLWSNRGFSYPFDVSDIEILTTEGRVTKTIANIEGTSRGLLFGISTQTVAWVFVFVLLGNLRTSPFCSSSWIFVCEGYAEGRGLLS